MLVNPLKISEIPSDLHLHEYVEVFKREQSNLEYLIWDKRSAIEIMYKVQELNALAEMIGYLYLKKEGV